MKKEIPILFSTPMVRAILDGKKTMTRRIMKHQPQIDELTGDVYLQSFNEVVPVKEYCKNVSDMYRVKIGDILYVRESWRFAGGFESKPDYEILDVENFVYKADGEWDGPFKPSIHLPKTGSRIWLEVTNVRAERVKDITEADAIAEGIVMNNKPHQGWYWMENVYATDSPLLAFKLLWNKINGNWEENPFVWVIEFKVLSTTGKP